MYTLMCLRLCEQCQEGMAGRQTLAPPPPPPKPLLVAEAGAATGAGWRGFSSLRDTLGAHPCVTFGLWLWQEAS